MTDVIKVFLSYNRFLFDGLMSVKIPWVRTFSTNLEVVSPDGHFVSGNLRQNVLLRDF
jgi:hypothetical protein